jgi:adenylate kinase
MNLIIITGSVATGKTTLALKLGKRLDYPVLDVKKFIEDKNISEAFDKKRRCKIIDLDKLNKALIKEIRKVEKAHMPDGIVIESHLSHYLPEKYVDLCIVTKCGLKELEGRLKRRGYNKSKIRENLDCEIFDVCLNEAREAGHKVLVINATKRLNMDRIAKDIKRTLK